jgi:hypothetical protein
LPAQPRLHHARVVEDEQVARRHERGQVAEHPVDDRAVRRDVQQAARAPLGGGVLGDQLGGKFEIEVGEQHGGIIGGGRL